MSLGYGILGFLNYKPMTGYDLAKAFGESLNFFWHAQNSHIYLELKKLEKKGYISGKTVIQSDKPNKRVFSITDSGRTAFLDWLSQGSGTDDTHFKNVFLMKVFFSGNQPVSQSIAMLRQYKENCEAYLQQMRTIPGNIESYGEDMDTYQTLFWQFTADYGYRFIKNCMEWAEQCMERLEDLRKNGR